MQYSILRCCKGIMGAWLLVAVLSLVAAGCASSPEPAAPSPVAEAAAASSTSAALPPAAQPAAAATTSPGSDTAASEPVAANGSTTAVPAASGAAAEPASAGQPQPAAAAALALAAPSQLLDSYRLTATSIVTSLLPGGDLRVAGTQLHGTWKRTAGPFGFDADFTLVNSSGDQRQQLGLVAIGDDAALLTDGAWSTIRRDSALPYTDPDSLLSLPFVTRINHGENLGRERLADVDVTHYRLTDPAVFAGAVQDILPLDAGSIRSVVLEGWVADAGFVVKYLLSVILDGVDYVDDAGNHVTVRQEIYATYGLSDVDAVPAIEWPADAQPPDTISVPGFMPNLFPLPEGATATPHLGLVEIRTLQTESEVADFYRSELGQLGWSFEGELGFYTAAKDGDVINLTILPDEASKETVIRVFAAGG